MNNSRFGDYLIYLNDFEVKDTIDTQMPANYLNLHVEIDNGGSLKIKLFDKCDEFTFPIVNFLFVSSNIPASPVYGVYISRQIRYSRDCDNYSVFQDRAQLDHDQ